MPANKFSLSHHQIEIDYTPGITPGLPALTYRDGTDLRTFTQSEITTDQTALGSLVSIPLLRSIDVGGERFGFFLPQLDVAFGQLEQFRTVGVYDTFSGPDSVPHSPPSWRCIQLHGTAQSAIVPLEETATP